MTNKRRGTLYIGVTTNLVRRIWEHKNNAVPSFTQKYGLHWLVYHEIHNHITEAVQRERRLKNWDRQWKIALIEKTNPEWRDLYEDICA